MTWTKITKVNESSGAGFLNEPGFLVDGFLAAASGEWTTITDATGTWVIIEKVEE